MSSEGLPPVYPPARGCDARLNAWCDANCPHSREHGNLLARLDAARNADAKAWRCYAQSTLTDDLMRYASGATYCTRHDVLLRELQLCLGPDSSTIHATVDATSGAASHAMPSDGPLSSQAMRSQDAQDAQHPLDEAPPPPPPPPQRQQRQQALLEAIRAPLYRNNWQRRRHHYEHDSRFRRLVPGLRVPRLDDCRPDLVDSAQFWAASLYTSSYAHKAQRLLASCEAWGVCCGAALVPDGAYEGLVEGDYTLRHYLIASKPLFMLEVWRASPLPLVWLDVDLEFHAFPVLFTPAGWRDVRGPRDVLLWNWQANVSYFQGRRLKMASGVAQFSRRLRRSTVGRVVRDDGIRQECEGPRRPSLRPPRQRRWLD